LSVFFGLFFAAVMLGGGATDPQTAGLQALEHRDYQKAQEIFSQLAASNPRDYSVLFNLALAETALQKDDQAAQHYKQVLELKPGLYEAELNLGMVDLRDHRPADAVPLLHDAAKQKPNQPRPQRYLGDSLLATGDPSGAAEAYRQALTLDPKLAGAELGLGQALLRQAKLDEAAPHYQTAASLDPKLKSFLGELGLAYAQAKRYDEAIALFKEFPDDAGAREQLGQLYLTTNRPADAVAQFQAAAQISPSPANEVALATAYLKNNQPDLAAPILERELAANPNDYELHMVIGRIHRDKHDYASAATQFVSAAQLKPEAVEAWNEAATSFVLAGLYPQALAALDKIHNLNADTAGDFYFRAVALDKMHQVKPALASYQRFLQLSQGKFPDQEFIARQRSRILKKEANR
jgi:tetratricopeptide (TPR) repeat protein